MVPNVLQAYAFDIDKLNAFTTFYNDLMLGNSGLSEVRARNDCRGRFINQSLFLLFDRSRRCRKGTVRRVRFSANNW